MPRNAADTTRGGEPPAPPPRPWEPWGRPTGPAGDQPPRTVTAQPGHRKTRKPKAS
ncbi:hypothetical protein ABVG11_15145 [Streptomyces sp. HD1123-B1]|uniref:hypothetical protein n=1 Tax=Streptomyces huangiella TaxID=3228804 RepID=UPI003D7E110E